MATSVAQEVTSQPTALQHAAHAAWMATREERADRYHRGLHCPTRTAPYGTFDPYGQAIPELCAAAGCLDLLHDLIARVLTKLDAPAARIDNLAAFSCSVARRELVEVKRAERARAGLPARPSRTDGVAGRVDAVLRQTGDGTAEWLVALFRIMRTYPYRPLHVPGRWPVDGLTRERELLLPHETSSPIVVRTEIARVLRIAKDVAGHDWVYTNLTLPLQAHGAQSELPDMLPATNPDAETMILGRQLKQTYQRLRLAGLNPDTAFARAAFEVTGLAAPLLTPELIEALAELEPKLAEAA